MTTPVTDIAPPVWSLQFRTRVSAPPTKIEKSIQEAVEAITDAYASAAKALAAKVHPLKDDTTYNKVYEINKLLKNIESSLGVNQAEEKLTVELLKHSMMSLKIGGLITPEDLQIGRG